MHNKSRLVLCAIFLFCLIPALAVAQVYRVTDLGILPTGTFSGANGINNLGHVVGMANIQSPPFYGERAFLWTQKGGMQDLGTLLGYDQQFFLSWANGVNDLGLVVGTSWHDLATNHAFIWSRTGGMVDLGIPPGVLEGSAGKSINLFGQVVGAGFDLIVGGGDGGIEDDPHAFLWTSAGGMQLLGNLPGGQYSLAYGINNLGQVVGVGETTGPCCIPTFDAFLWTSRDGMLDIGAWTAVAINNLGQVVGVTLPGQNEEGGTWGSPDGHAARWTSNHGLQDLGTLPGGNSSSAVAIDDFGLVVGWSATASPNTFHAMLWSPHSGMWDLNNLIRANSGWVLYEATGINIWGQVVGWGTLNGQSHGFLLTPKKL
jgi:probable HAF family extracellular repeat protein